MNQFLDKSKYQVALPVVTSNVLKDFSSQKNETKMSYPRKCQCDRVCINKWQWYRHRKICPASQERGTESVLSVFKEDSLLEIIKELKEELTELKKAPKMINNGTINATNNINIAINVYGREDTTHITDELREICMQHGNDGVLKLIKEVHFNPAKPENQNLRISTLKDFYNGFVEVFGPEGWEPAMKTPLYKKLWKRMFSEMMSLYAVWEWEGDDCIQEKLGNKEPQISAFMKQHDGINPNSIKRSYIKPIDCFMIKHYNASRQK